MLTERDPYTELIVPLEVEGVDRDARPACSRASPAVQAYFDESLVRVFEAGTRTDSAAAVAEVICHPDRRSAGKLERLRGTFLPRCGWERVKVEYLALVNELATVARSLGGRPSQADCELCAGQCRARGVSLEAVVFCP